MRDRVAGPDPASSGERRHGEEPAYAFVRGSDIGRGGMFLELERVHGQQRETVCEVFHSDVDGSLTFTAYERGPLPLDRVEELIRRARVVLPPKS